MLQSHASMPFVKALEQERLEFECVVGRRVWHAHQFGVDQQHEYIVLISTRSRDCAAIGREIELGEERPEPLHHAWPTAFAHGFAASYPAAAAADALRFSRMKADAASSMTKIAATTINRSMKTRK